MVFPNKSSCFSAGILGASIFCTALSYISKWFVKQREKTLYSSIEEIIVLNKESDNLQYSTCTDSKSTNAEQNVFKEEIQESDILQNLKENRVLKQNILETQESNIYNLLNFQLQDEFEESVNLLPITEPRSIQRIHLNHQLIRDLASALNVNYPVDEFLNKPYTLTRLLATSDEYQKIHKRFYKENYTYFNIEFIFKINNIFLHLQYLLLKAKYKWYYSHLDVDGSIMYHGTKHEFLPDICCWNFDKAKVKTHKYGNGISFAKKPGYATFYHKDNQRSNCKVMILAHVLNDIGPSCIGNSSLVIPPAPSYTSTNRDQSVTVKYEDASFYPSYLISYKGVHPQYRYSGNWNF